MENSQWNLKSFVHPRDRKFHFSPHDIHCIYRIAGNLHYFNASSDITKLPDPCGPLSTTLPSSSIESANAEVKWAIETKESSDRQKEATMRVFSWFQIGKYTAENGVAATMCFYAKKFVLKESSVRTWKNVSFWAGAYMRWSCSINEVWLKQRRKIVEGEINKTQRRL